MVPQIHYDYLSLSFLLHDEDYCSVSEGGIQVRELPTHWISGCPRN